MTVNDLYEIADRIERLAFEADGFNKPLKLVLAEICDLAEELRDEADTLAENMAKEAA
mgnify:CR=1 FL=1|jgi:uncharacterized coiled-coil DUF342 family protein